MSKKNSKSCKEETIIDILTGECVSLSKERGKLIAKCQEMGMHVAYDPETTECVDTRDTANVDIRRRLAKRNKRLVKIKRSDVPEDIQCYRLDGKESACGKLSFCSYNESTKKCSLTASLTELERAIISVKEMIEKFPKDNIILADKLKEHTKLMGEIEQKKNTLVLMKIKYEKTKTYDRNYAKTLFEFIQHKLDRSKEIENDILSIYQRDDDGYEGDETF